MKRTVPLDRWRTAPSRQPIAFEMNGIVTEENRPVPGAKVTVILDPYDSYGAEPWVLTDASGGYRVTFVGVPGANLICRFVHVAPRDGITDL